MILRWFGVLRGVVWLLVSVAVMTLFFCIKVLLGIVDGVLGFVQSRVDAAFNYLYGDF